MAKLPFPEKNPFSPGAGHSPPFLAGREDEVAEWSKHLEQDILLKNAILTGLRGTGKTVLMEDKYRPLALKKGWAWVGSDFSEASFLSEENLCTRLITDLSVFTATLLVATTKKSFGFSPERTNTANLSFDFLTSVFESTPGLMVDKLKATLELVWEIIKANKKIRGIVFAYDEAQVVGDRPEKDQYPLAILLETFQSIQRKGARLLLLLTGLPTLFPRLVESRTYAERMFSVQEIGKLAPAACREAIAVPTKKTDLGFSDRDIKTITAVSAGYPYFIQFLCKEAFDYLCLNARNSKIPIEAIVRKLDADFFAGRWENLTDRQREFLYCVAGLEGAEEEFTIAEIVAISHSRKVAVKRFTPGDVSQMLPRLIDKGILYRNRLGKYCFAVPLFSRFIRRKLANTPKEFQKSLF